MNYKGDDCATDYQNNYSFSSKYVRAFLLERKSFITNLWVKCEIYCKCLSKKCHYSIRAGITFIKRFCLIKSNKMSYIKKEVRLISFKLFKTNLVFWNLDRNIRSVFIEKISKIRRITTKETHLSAIIIFW